MSWHDHLEFLLREHPDVLEEIVYAKLEIAKIEDPHNARYYEDLRATLDDTLHKAQSDYIDDPTTVTLRFCENFGLMGLLPKSNLAQFYPKQERSPEEILALMDEHNLPYSDPVERYGVRQSTGNRLYVWAINRENNFIRVTNSEGFTCWLAYNDVILEED